MGTSGLFGFVIDDVLKVTYNHFDSYPGGLGDKMLTWLHNARGGLDILKEQARNLELIDDNIPPTEEQIEKLKEWTNLSVGNQRLNDWYCLLRETQGNPEAALKCGFMVDSKDFAADGLFCEWGYVVDFDHQSFEIYRGFEKKPHSGGRFSDMKSNNEYYPIKMIGVYSFGNLPETFTEEEMKFWIEDWGEA